MDEKKLKKPIVLGNMTPTKLARMRTKLEKGAFKSDVFK